MESAAFLATRETDTGDRPNGPNTCTSSRSKAIHRGGDALVTDGVRGCPSHVDREARLGSDVKVTWQSRVFQAHPPTGFLSIVH